MGNGGATLGPDRETTHADPNRVWSSVLHLEHQQLSGSVEESIPACSQ